jgi:hypothetical protein
MQTSQSLSERDKDIIRNKSDHVFMRLCQWCNRTKVHPSKAMFWDNLKKLVWESGCTDTDGRFDYGVEYLSPKVDALYEE